MPITALDQNELRASLLSRLSGLRAPAGVHGTVSHGTDSGVRVFGYCVQERERIARSRMEHPAVVVVLSGTKEIWHGDVAQAFPAGVPFVIPAGMNFDMVNIPDPASGRYESICITVDDVLRQALRSNLRHLPVTGRIPDRLDVELSPALVEAYGHAASALSGIGVVAVAETLARYRVLEVLLLVAVTPVAGVLMAVGRREQVEAIIYADPSHPWQVGEVAAELGIGASTLRRQLAGAGASFREVLLSVRMRAAGALLGSSGYSVMQAAQAAGYASRSHFSRRVQAVHGKTPRQLKAAV
ncbi:AraC family transcriptional regulator [Sphingomonas sp. S2-65]|uniref:AraC family transcriptional regulator n=1 Tax=Sphingomonas sp. S2-65 TaxID=2903960 RepID=UPI001F199627|nr:AraC family transcriptional regulator [Sphingomonas sp. S2-65]UYY57125.1 AraC family transcriptional regulator [Sphingomonas sp. S2-65]